MREGHPGGQRRVGVDDDSNPLSASQNSRSPGFVRVDSTRTDSHLSHRRNASDNAAHTSAIDPRLQTPHDLQDDPPAQTNVASTPSLTASPRFSDPSFTSSPNVQQQFFSAYTPQDRKLPSKDVSDETIDDAYSEFILYCNPSFPPNADTTELRKAFRAPPKSDGKSFNIFNLFELIRKYNNKDIKTWTQLALELGVEPPSTEKGQSTQKVQQYSVRLKRWMRAMHVDAFFEFLLDKPHVYYTHIPPADMPRPENGRDGVILEEDLAIRAIDPSYRPKRGRRKLDEQEDENERTMTPAIARRPNTEAGFSPHPFSAQPMSAFPPSAYPVSAHPDDGDRYTITQDQWPGSAVTPHPASQNPNTKLLTPHSAITASTPQHLRWRFHNQNANDGPQSAHPLSAQPMSAVTPTTGLPPDSALDEPQSAVTPTADKPRKRRRHGPAVSSAWSSSTHTPSGKLRGRPPSNRSVRDGPFVTFPANPQRDEAPTIDLRTSETPLAERPEVGAMNPPPASAIETEHDPFSEQQRQASEQITSAGGSGTPASAGPSGRAKLSLQVPRHTGGPVQQISGPQPPTLLVNGDPERLATGPGAQDERSNHDRQNVSASQRQSESHNGVSTSSIRPFSSSSPTQLHFQAKVPFSQGVAAFDQAPPQRRTTTSIAPEPSSPKQRGPKLTSFTSEELKRALATDLLRADIVGRTRLKGTEAKSLAEALLINLHSQGRPSTPPDSDAADSSAEEAHKLAAALWLGLGAQLGVVDRGVAPAGGQKKIVVRRSKMGEDGYEVPLDDDDPTTLGVVESFDISWSLLMGGLAAEFSVKGLMIAGGGFGKAPGGASAGPGLGSASDLTEGPLAAAIGPGVTFAGTGYGSGFPSLKDPMQNAVMWKRRFEDLKRKTDRRDVEMEELKDKILGLVL
ncbi:MAG: hypothetical protein Q9157_003786 [Trypethelium eluteriae]